MSMAGVTGSARDARDDSIISNNIITWKHRVVIHVVTYFHIQALQSACSSCFPCTFSHGDESRREPLQRQHGHTVISGKIHSEYSHSQNICILQWKYLTSNELKNFLFLFFFFFGGSRNSWKLTRKKREIKRREKEERKKRRRRRRGNRDNITSSFHFRIPATSVINKWINKPLEKLCCNWKIILWVTWALVTVNNSLACSCTYAHESASDFWVSNIAHESKRDESNQWGKNNLHDSVFYYSKKRDTFIEHDEAFFSFFFFLNEQNRIHEICSVGEWVYNKN